MITSHVDCSIVQVPPFRVVSTGYRSPVLSIADDGFELDWDNIDNLDDIVVFSKRISISLDFPFPVEHIFVLESHRDGITRKELIDFIRNSYLSLFKLSESPAYRWERSLMNKETTTDYHVCYPLSGIFVSLVTIDRKKSHVTVSAECFPVIDDEINLPF